MQGLPAAGEIPSLPSTFHSQTVHSPAGADIFVRWGGPVPSSSSSTDTLRTAIHGRPSPPIS